MSLEDRKAALRREVERKRQDIARAERYIESIEAMPDLDELVEGSVVAMTVTYGRSRPYPHVAYKGGGKWYLTGKNAPNGVTGDELSEWLMSGGRHLRMATILAEFTVEPVSQADAMFDLAAALATGLRDGHAFLRNTFDEASGRGL